MKILLLLFSISFSSVVLAEFENTKWGMNLYDLRLAYQNGYTEKQDENTNEYQIEKELQMFGKTEISFILSSDKLNAVIIELISKKELSACEVTYNELIVYFITLYGSPDFQDDNKYAWNIKSKESVMITTKATSNKCIPWIVYLSKTIVVNDHVCNPLRSNNTCK